MNSPSSVSLRSRRLPGILAAGSVFFSALLLFCVQPMMGRLLLPRFGGVASVWIVCLLIYQALLFAGYAYAHGLCGRSARFQRAAHLALAGAALAWMAGALLWAGTPLWTADPTPDAPPQWRAGLMLVAAIGLPYLCLASTSTLVQFWLARRGGSARVYHLYGISNAGSFAGLMLYPFALELFLPLKAQQVGWFVAFGVFLGLLAAYAVALRGKRWRNEDGRGGEDINHEGQEGHEGEGGTEGGFSGGCEPLAGGGKSGSQSRHYREKEREIERLNHEGQEGLEGGKGAGLWLGLSMAGTFLLVSGTSHLTLDITPLPALWVIILGAYLASFVIGFSRIGERLLPLWCLLALGAATAQALITWSIPSRGLAWTLPSGLAMVFLGCVFLHSWLHRLRPTTAELSRFYLFVAGGGGLGGILGSLAAPLVFPDVWEYPLSVVLTVGFACLYLRREKPPQIAAAGRFALLAAVVTLLGNGLAIHRELDKSLTLRRGFYGLVRVVEGTFRTAGGETGVWRRMVHGSTTHGGERWIGERRLPPATYFADFAGGPSGLEQHPRRDEPGFHVGVIGLGVGELLGYARTDDRWRVYEISPEVIDLASDPRYFSYVSDCPAALEIVEGDARQALEREREAGALPRFDVLFVDAYSGDAVPAHLVTREAFVLFLDRLAPDGRLVLQMTNWHIDLYPLAKTIAREFGLHIEGVRSREVPARSAHAADWVVLSRVPFSLELEQRWARKVDWERIAYGPLLTDRRGSVLSYVDFNRKVPLVRPEGDGEDIFSR